MAKELLPIVLSIAVWGPQLWRHQVLYQCDNSSVVVAIKKGSSRDAVVMQLLHSLRFFVVHYCILHGGIKGFNSSITTILVVIELWLGNYRTLDY